MALSGKLIGATAIFCTIAAYAYFKFSPNWNATSPSTANTSQQALLDGKGLAGANAQPQSSAQSTQNETEENLADHGKKSINDDILKGAWGRFQTGDYEGAISVLRAQLASFPDNALVKTNLATSLYALALVKIKSQLWSEAEKLLEESGRLGNKDAARTLASLKLKLGNSDLASGLFESLVDETQDPESIKVLVDISLRTDNFDRAEYFLNKLPASDPYVTQKRTRLELKRAFALTQDTVTTNNGIEVAFEAGTPQVIVAKVSSAMEGTLNLLSAALLGVPQQFRFKAYLFKRDSFAQTTEAPPWAGGLFDGQINLPVARQAFAARPSYTARDTLQSQPKGERRADQSNSDAVLNYLADDLARVAKHEMTHAYLYAFCGDTIPSWLGEGLAQRAEGRPASSAFFELKKRSEKVDNTPTAALDGNFIEADGASVGRMYAQSYLLVKALADNIKLNNTPALQRPSSTFENFKGLLQRACLGKENIEFALQSEFGAGTAAGLWQAHTR